MAFATTFAEALLGVGRGPADLVGFARTIVWNGSTVSHTVCLLPLALPAVTRAIANGRTAKEALTGAPDLQEFLQTTWLA
jgi:hypothetical protein